LVNADDDKPLMTRSPVFPRSNESGAPHPYSRDTVTGIVGKAGTGKTTHDARTGMRY
jgi:hypothetical protein